ncbi:guanine nucleotide-binding protein-like protein alpha-3 subunit [Plenodomus tracheiphilus IPT5]|uniref:Guanine nucleotide-binding protein-like protein alpha-3 subunit n=1 Tax=Plenodomus tracheiphilus IPT5 TaxID=1408161 RepID=A0A6A7BCC3_9PLEO|nr:guanine nucleotide-binding protein-like protein alpha-3 subunit [Plenodomus tracheiphilus IPT5]
MQETNEKRVHALISAVGNNRERLHIDELRKIHDRASNDSSINLIAQLTALKSNLGTIQDWLNFAIHDLHPQLLSDLDVLMVSCGSLVRHLDTLTERLGQPDNDAMDFAVKLKYAVGCRSMERLRDVAQRQNEAVTLLLAACKCHASAQRKILLHKSRQIRKEDAANLKTLARSTRWNGSCIGVLTQISRMIQWFRFLFHMKLAQNEVDRDMTPTGEWYEFAAAANRSDAIDRALQEEATTLRRETKLVMVGDFNSGKQLVMHQMKVLYAEGYHSQEQRAEYCYAVRSTVRLLIHSMIDLLKDTGIALPPHLTQHFAILLTEVETTDINHITPEAVTALSAIWLSPEFSSLYTRNFEIDFPQYAPYFAQEAPRIAHKDYVPTEADIIRLNRDLGGIKEVRFHWDELSVHLFNINGHIPTQFQKRWFHQLENATSLVYTVDVSRYDRPHLGQAAESQLLYDFQAFESWATSPKFANSSIILLLNNFSRFCDKLQHLPLQTFFPEYKPSEAADAETSARRYILKRFKDLNRNRLSIYSFWVDLDMSDNQHLYAALKKTLQHIQQRKARSEVWSEDGTSASAGNLLARTFSGSLGGRRHGLNKSRSLSTVLSEETR